MKSWKRQEKDVENSGDVPALKADTDSDARLTQARLLALDEHLTGISFSGGGIRSGTFAVGLLQGLSSLGLLRRFDYLSTVSGGGYAGGWLASWLKRDGDVRNVERQLAASRVRQGEAYRDFLNPLPGDDYPTTAKPVRGPVVDEEPEPIYHLRSYSSYMAPQLGLLTADTWTIIMIWLRNVSVNLMMFLPLGMVVVLVARLLLNIYASLTSERFARSTTLTVAQVDLVRPARGRHLAALLRVLLQRPGPYGVPPPPADPAVEGRGEEDLLPDGVPHPLGGPGPVARTAAGHLVDR